MDSKLDNRSSFKGKSVVPRSVKDSPEGEEEYEDVDYRPSRKPQVEPVDIPAGKGKDSRHADLVNSYGSRKHEEPNAHSQPAFGRDDVPPLEYDRHFSLNPGDSSSTRKPQWGPTHVPNTSAYQSGLNAPRTSSAPYAPLQYPPRQPSGFGRGSGDLSLSADSRPEPCHLTPLGQRFARIRVGQIKECVNFIMSEQAVLKENPQHYLREAGVLYRKSKIQDARACVQQALVIDHCSDLDKEDIQEYLSDLRTLRRSTVHKLLGNVDKTFDAVKAKSDESTHIEDTGPRHATTADRSRHIPAERQYSLKDDQMQRSPSPTTSDLVNKFSSVNIDTERLPGVSESMPPEAVHRNRHRPPAGSTASRSSAGNHASWNSVRIEDVKIRGTEGEFEPLNPRYRQRHDKPAYFIVGRVFAILWHENMGMTSKKPGPDVQYTRDNRFGERIFSHIRRMIVVRQRYGYCWCVSINTYGGRGLGGKNRSDQENQSHTIVYDSTSKPAMFKDEQGLMTKEPIAIDMVDGHTLDKASRLNYAKVCTVEHNVKVMDIGMVSSGSIPFLMTHWKAEMAT